MRRKGAGICSACVAGVDEFHPWKVVEVALLAGDDETGGHGVGLTLGVDAVACT